MNEQLADLDPALQGLAGTQEALDGLAYFVGQRLATMGARIVTAESCTGGGIARALTERGGASTWFDRGFVTYSNQAKQDILGVSGDLLEAHGAVSELVARAMALGALKSLGPTQITFALSVTGIAGPGGGSPGKPVGLVYLGIAGTSGVETIEKKLVPERKTFKAMASQAALNLLRVKLLANPFHKTEV